MPLEVVNRWVLIDTVSADRYVFPINPNQMSKPFNQKNLTVAPNVKWGPRTSRTPTVPQKWSFSGVLRDKAMHDELQRWAEKPDLVIVNDHLDRELTVLLVQFDFTERRPSYRTSWRGTYQMESLLFSQSGGGVG